MRKRMIAGILILTAVAVGVLIFSATPRYGSSTNLDVIPGVGIKDAIEVGMTLQEVKWSTRDVEVTTYPSTGLTNYDCSVPSIGAGFSLQEKERPIGSVSFDIQHPTMRYAVDVLPFYRGTIGGELSCAEGNFINREDVVRVFGTPARTLDHSEVYPVRGSHCNDGRTIEEVGAEVAMVDAMSEPYAILDKETEKLIYPSLGITFILDESVVYLVHVHKKGEPSSPHVSTDTPPNGDS